ncbi:hypothetical protein Q7689_05290, partial [Nocardiopsis tropica]|nr:hypothetical protein [Nocardiopsis tropica]
AEGLHTSASTHWDSADRAAQDAQKAGEEARRAAGAAEKAREAADEAAEVSTRAKDATDKAEQADDHARAARAAADRAVRAAVNTPQPSPGGQTTSDGTDARGTTDTRQDTARRATEDARERARQARQTTRDAVRTTARTTEEAEQLAQQAKALRTRAETTGREAADAATRAEEALETAQEVRDTADATVEAADRADATARRAHQEAQEAAQKAEAASERAAEAAETAREARDDAGNIADSARKRITSVRNLLERIPAAGGPVRTSSEGSGGDRSDGGDRGSGDNRRSGNRDGSGTGTGGRGRGTDGDGGSSSRGKGRGGHDIIAFPMTEVPNQPGNPSPQAASDRMADAIRLGKLASASIRDAISGYQRAQDLVAQTREAESQARPDTADLRAQAYQAQREANDAYRAYDFFAQMQADLLRPDGPTTVMAVLETTGKSSRDPGPVPLGGTSRDVPLGTLNTDSPVHQEETPPEGAPPEGSPPQQPSAPTYTGAFTPDRDKAFDLGYLTTSNLLGPNMLFAEHLHGFVDDVLAGTPDMPAAVRRAILDGVAAILTKEGPRPFLREGGHTVSTTHDGQTWSADIDLRSLDGDFYHFKTESLSGGDSTHLRLHSAGPGVSSSEAGSQDGGGTVGAKFTGSPIYLANVSGSDAGPIFSIGTRGGLQLRSTGGSAAISANSSTGIELLGTPNVYVSDLRMKASVTGPGLTAPRVQEGTAYNGLTMNLPGEVVPSDAPRHIVPDTGPADANGNRPPVNRPLIGTGHPLEITRFSPVPPASGDGTDGDTAGTSGGTDRGGDGDRDDSTTTDGGGRPGKGTLGTWLADHFLGTPPQGGRGGGRAPSRQERRDNQYREAIESTFDNDRVQQYLPQMVNSSAHIRIEIPGSRPRIMQMWSVSTEYNRKDFAPGLADFVHSNTAVKSDSSGVKHSTVASGSIGGGFGIWIDLPNGRSIRLDVPFVEYSATFEKSTGTTLSTSGTSSHVVHAPAGHAAYDVKRDFYVHIQGESQPHRFEADTVEMLTVEDARLLNGEPSKAPTSTDGPAAPPRPPFPNLAVDHPTDLSGATVRGFGHAPPAPPADDTATTGTTGNTDATNTTDTTGNDDADGDTQAPPSPQRPFYDDLAYNVLKGIAEKHPGMVIPDLARTDKDYAVRPSRMDPEGPLRSFRERWGLRRNVDVARDNTLKVIKALSESGLKSGASDLPGNGIPVRLKESAVIDPTMLRRDKGSRPDAVTVRVYGDFDRLVHQFDTTSSGGARFAGSAGITTTKGSSVNHSLGLNVGASVRTDEGADARGVPRVLGNPSGSLNTSLSTGKGSSQGLSHSSEETVLFSGDSDVWTSRTRFTARLFEHDDIGMARDDRPQREHGIPLLGKGMDAETVLLTPKMPPMATDSPATVSDPAGTTRDGDTATSSDGQETRNTPATAADTRGEDSTRTDTSGDTEPDTTGGRQPLTPEQARDMIRRNFVPQTAPGGTPGGDRGGRWTVIRDGAVHTWGRLFGESAQVVTPPPNTTAPPAGTVTTTVADGNRAVALSPPPSPGTTAGTNDNQAVVLSPPERGRRP